MSTEIYRPTPRELEGIRPQADKLKVSGDGVFATLQGEGVTTGACSVFLRLHYCNLTCGIPKGWQCDTGYTWDASKREFWQEPEDWSYDYASAQIEKVWIKKFENKKYKRLVITGGEPLIQQKKIAALLEIMQGWEVEIETNGTIKPISELSNCQMNCSPKLENSGNTINRRYKPDVLKYINNLPKSQFKFVVVEPSDLEEIDSIVDECRLYTEKVLIMPEGQTANEVSIHANKIKGEVLRRGWQITLRNQLIWFGQERRT